MSDRTCGDCKVPDPDYRNERTATGVVIGHGSYQWAGKLGWLCGECAQKRYPAKPEDPCKTCGQPIGSAANHSAEHYEECCDCYDKRWFGGKKP